MNTKPLVDALNRVLQVKPKAADGDGAASDGQHHIDLGGFRVSFANGSSSSWVNIGICLRYEQLLLLP